ncbi:CACTA en-spm transposon protein [Cucumis melo var. makuwa]|uniref:CACTA en-spm transposon protein n=1 Tax=Cucumis melo var. makuwa TaxID=1194695 RepID=A0A5A7TKN0_CUCMM|nr:CACTA en-spm transposon protein [Cucumis melo var. makuwa]
MSTGTMSNFPVSFDKSNDLFDFNVEEFNTIPGTSLVGDTSAVTRFVEHQMLTVWKEFRGQNHHHFKKFDDPEQARANPPDYPPFRLSNRVQDWHFLCDHYLTQQFQQLSMDRVARTKKTHARGGQFVLRTAADAHKKILELQSQPTLEGSQPLFGDEICETVLGRRPGYLKDLGPKPKS